MLYTKDWRLTPRTARRAKKCRTSDVFSKPQTQWSIRLGFDKPTAESYLPY